MENPSYYAIIPADVRYSDIKANAKLLYGEITALSNKTGICFASNSYFANLYGVSDKQVSLWIKELMNKWFIDVVIKQEEGNKRYITIHQKVTTYTPKGDEGIHQKVWYNNTSNNNTSKISTKVDTPDGDITPSDPKIETTWKKPAHPPKPPSQDWRSDRSREDINTLIKTLRETAKELWFVYDNDNERFFCKHILDSTLFWDFAQKIWKSRTETAVRIMIQSKQFYKTCMWPKAIYKNYAQVYNDFVQKKQPKQDTKNWVTNLSALANQWK